MTDHPAEPAAPRQYPVLPSPDAEYASPLLRRILVQGLYETRAMLLNGEQLLLSIVIPVCGLFALVFTNLIDPAVQALNSTRINVATPGVLALAVLSTAFTGQGIQTGFDRRYGILRYFAVTPLGKSGLIAGKVLSVTIIVGIQSAVIGIVAVFFQWQPYLPGIIPTLLLLVLGAVTFTSLGLLIAGTVRPEATLAVTNLAWIACTAVGGIVFPGSQMPPAVREIIQVLPSGALGELMRSALIMGKIHWFPIAVLLLWCFVGIGAALKFFTWE